jgi:hypothetical protein
MATVTDERATERTPAEVPYLPMFLIVVAVFAGVSALNPPIWLGALLAGVLGVAGQSLLRAIMRRRAALPGP